MKQLAFILILTIINTCLCASDNKIVRARLELLYAYVSTLYLLYFMSENHTWLATPIISLVKILNKALDVLFLLTSSTLPYNLCYVLTFHSCPGCSLNRLQEVRSFFYEDVPKYENVEWKKISGAPPEVIFLDEADEEVERHLLGRLSRKECNELLQSKGFKLTKDKEL